jgi:hypothetical protein
MKERTSMLTIVKRAFESVRFAAIAFVGSKFIALPGQRTEFSLHKNNSELSNPQLSGDGPFRSRFPALLQLHMSNYCTRCIAGYDAGSISHYITADDHPAIDWTGLRVVLSMDGDQSLCSGKDVA